MPQRTRPGVQEFQTQSENEGVFLHSRGLWQSGTEDRRAFWKLHLSAATRAHPVSADEGEAEHILPTGWRRIALSVFFCRLDELRRVPAMVLRQCRLRGVVWLMSSSFSLVHLNLLCPGLSYTIAGAHCSSVTMCSPPTSPLQLTWLHLTL